MVRPTVATGVHCGGKCRRRADRAGRRDNLGERNDHFNTIPKRRWPHIWTRLYIGWATLAWDQHECLDACDQHHEGRHWKLHVQSGDQSRLLWKQSQPQSLRWVLSLTYKYSVFGWQAVWVKGQCKIMSLFIKRGQETFRSLVVLREDPSYSGSINWKQHEDQCIVWAGVKIPF